MASEYKTPWTDQANEAFNQRNAATCCAHLIPYLKPHHRILDVGCGPGSITLDLARYVPDGHILGIDVSADPIAAAQKDAKTKNLTNVEFREGDATDLSAFESESFDVVHAHQVLMYLDNRADIMREMRRIVKTGGVISTRDTVALHRYPIMPPLERQVEIWQAYINSTGGDMFFGRVSQAAAHEAGFPWKNIQMSSWGWEWSHGDSKEKMANLGKFGLNERFLEAGLATQKEIDDAVVAWDVWKEQPGSRLMVLDGAVLCLK